MFFVFFRIFAIFREKRTFEPIWHPGIPLEMAISCPESADSGQKLVEKVVFLRVYGRLCMKHA